MIIILYVDLQCDCVFLHFVVLAHVRAISYKGWMYLSTISITQKNRKINLNTLKTHFSMKVVSATFTLHIPVCHGDLPMSIYVKITNYRIRLSFVHNPQPLGLPTPNPSWQTPNLQPPFQGLGTRLWGPNPSWKGLTHVRDKTRIRMSNPSLGGPTRIGGELYPKWSSPTEMGGSIDTCKNMSKKIIES